MTRHGGRLYQTTWRSGKAWTYAVDDFGDVAETATPLSDGWGITSDGAHLIVGDSSERLTFVDPESMQAVREITVTGEQPLMAAAGWHGAARRRGAAALHPAVRAVALLAAWLGGAACLPARFVARPPQSTPAPPCARCHLQADGGKPVPWLNELEYIDGLIWGNVSRCCLCCAVPTALPPPRRCGCSCCRPDCCRSCRLRLRWPLCCPAGLADGLHRAGGLRTAAERLG